MKITKLLPQQKNPNRFNLYVDGVFKCGISTSTIALNTLYESKEISEEELDGIVNNEIYNRFYDRAITYVTGALKTEKAVKLYLKRVFLKKKKDWIGDDVVYDIEDTISKVIKRLKELSLLSDKVYADSFVGSRQLNRPRSKQMLISELLAKGVDLDMAKQSVSDLSDEELIYDVYLKKFGTRLFNVNEDTKIVRFLAGKGFSWDEISKLERRLKDEFGE